MASALLLGLILVCTGLTSGDVTEFQCTNGSVYAGDIVECNCTTSTVAIDWNISYIALGSCDQNLIHVKSEPFNAATTDNTTEYYGYNFTYNADNNSSSLIFYLNASESISVTCRNGDKGDGATLVIPDAGYVKALINLTTDFNASGITLHWEDIGNNCDSTEYQVTVISCSCTSTSVLTYSTNDTALHINSSDLLENVTYTYTVRGWNEQQSNNSKPFTLGNDTITSQCEPPQNNNGLGTPSFNVTITANSTTNNCNDSCCTNITIFIQLVLNTSDPQYANLSYNISYDSITINEESMITNEGEWNKNIQLPHNEMHYSDSEQAKNQCKMTISESNSASSCPMEDCEKLSGGCIAAISVLGVLLLMAIAVIVCSIILGRNRSVKSNKTELKNLVSPNDDEPDGNKPDKNKPDGNEIDENNLGGGNDKPDGNKSDGNKPDKNKPDGNEIDENNLGGGNDKPDGNKSDGNKSDGNKPDGNEPDGNKPCQSPTGNDEENEGGGSSSGAVA
ncbi:PREDICTED: hybrid signal transduction histidine kinase A-like, partial [Amphimedon queenslandica]|uniref:Fibronectin type-III domain-containing protein n=1 Tax=Amphimedon queenslandica TaxID=400682 RepID=A0AAN0JZX7_AMPQE